MPTINISGKGASSVILDSKHCHAVCRVQRAVQMNRGLMPLSGVVSHEDEVDRRRPILPGTSGGAQDAGHIQCT